MIGNPVKTLGNNMLSGFQGKIFKCSFSDRQFGQYICSGKTWVAFHLNYFYLHQWLEIHTMFIKMGSPTLYTLKKKTLKPFPVTKSFIIYISYLWHSDDAISKHQIRNVCFCCCYYRILSISNFNFVFLLYFLYLLLFRNKCMG